SLREYLLDDSCLINMVHLGAKAFEDIGGEVVQTTMFVMKNDPIKNYKSHYLRLVDVKDPILKEKEFLNDNHRYYSKNSDFQKIPGSPIAYWVSDKVRDTFDKYPLMSQFAKTRIGMATGDNAKFVRNWHEVFFNKIGFSHSRESAKSSIKKWFPYANGGPYRKWYGNYEDIVLWENDGYILQTEMHPSGRIRAHNFNLDCIFNIGLTWSLITSSVMSVKILPKGFLFSSGSPSLYSTNELLHVFIALLNSNLFRYYFSFLSPTMNCNPGEIERIPINIKIFKKVTIKETTSFCIKISKTDWDSFETSWDFEVHPFLKHKEDGSIRKAFENWERFTGQQFQQLKDNEEELNRIFIDIYGLQDELTPDVPDEEITIRQADRERDVKSFLSYAVGCMFGRYSLDNEGLAYAGGDFDASKYATFPADDDNIIPVLDADYF
ncbi:MAG: SAM-dependent methyltransferase, partial [Candidatus Omnitrophica bacterium]|nr:SAM-dependent methyltransferase [Candidatus Omnitrophota bacterium]